MHTYSVDYRRDEPRRRGQLVNRGFWVHLPRPLLVCRLLGHKPVVDGTEGFRDQPGRRWVCCDRDGVRPEPQGSLDPNLPIGQPYTGGHGGRWIRDDPGHLGKPAATDEPGPWPHRPEGVLGGQLVLGGGYSGLSVQLKVGNAGSEHTLAAHLTLGFIGALYLHTERFGTWWQRRLNPVGYDSRVTGVRLGDGRLWWELWAKRDHASRDDSWWQRGSLVLDPRDRLLGPRRYTYDNVGEPATGMLRMPHGDDYAVTLQLQRQTFGRRRGRSRRSWTVDCDCPGGVPTRPDRSGGAWGFGVDVSDVAVREDWWPAEALAAAALRLTRDRGRRGWRPAEPELVG
jgi:hypothetical protein